MPELLEHAGIEGLTCISHADCSTTTHRDIVPTYANDSTALRCSLPEGRVTYAGTTQTQGRNHRTDGRGKRPACQ